MRRRYRYDAELDAVVEIGGNYFEEQPKGLNVIGDGLPGGVSGMRSHADGRMYDSKSRYVAEVRARGFEIVGDDNKPPARSRPHPDDYMREVVTAREQLAGNWNGTADWAEKQRRR
jgi:hypothetical protein